MKPAESRDPKSPQKWLITGGCGFIGTRLLSVLVEEGHQVRILDNLSIGTRDDLGTVCSFRESASEMLPWGDVVGLVTADIVDAHAALAASRGADVIVHLAAQSGVATSIDDPRHDLVSNVVGTFNYLEAARINGVPRLVYASSGAAVGEVDPPLREDILPRPISPYGVSKLCTEYYSYCYSKTFGIDTAGLRFGNVYGPGSRHKGSVVAKFIRRALAGEAWEIYGDGGQTRDFIYVDDLVDSIRLAASVQGIGGEVFQIATSRETTVQEITEALLLVLRSRGVDGIRVSNAGERLGDVRRNYSDTSKAARLLGWKAQTDLVEGLEKTVDWFLAEAAVVNTGQPV